MLTIFSVPKPFEGHIGTIQRNALRSWTALDPPCQVIVCGDEPGTAEVAAELGVEHLPEVERNGFGTPLLSSVFGSVEAHARHDLLCYANGDLILLPDLLDALGPVVAAHERFLVVGEATDLWVREELVGDFEDDVRRAAAARGSLRGRWWIDYFVFRRGTIGPLPAFAVGRPAWDNWMIWRARSLGMPVVDATPSVLTIHQRHEYGHVAGLQGRRWDGPEGDRNRRLAGPDERAFSLDDATHRLTAAGLAANPRTLRRRVRNEVALHDWAIPLHRPLRRAYHRIRAALARS